MEEKLCDILVTTALYVDGADAMAVDLRVWDGKECLLKIHCAGQFILDYFEMPCVTLVVLAWLVGVSRCQRAIEKKKRKLHTVCLINASSHL